MAGEGERGGGEGHRTQAGLNMGHGSVSFVEVFGVGKGSARGRRVGGGGRGHVTELALRDAALDREVAALLRPAGNADRDQQRQAVEEWFHIERAAELLDARDADREDRHAHERAPHVHAAGADGGGAEERAHERRQQKFEAHARLPDLQARGQHHAGKTRQRSRSDERAHHMLAHRNTVELRRLRVGADHVERAAQRRELGDEPQCDGHRQHVERTDRQAEEVAPGDRHKTLGQFAQHLPATAVPQRHRVDDGAGAERGDEGIDLHHLDQQAVEHAEQRAAQNDDHDRQRPRHAELGLQADREDVPQHDAVADRQVDLAGDHRDGGGERQQRDHRLVGQDRAQVEQRRKGVGQHHREQQRQQHQQHHEAVDGNGAHKALHQRQRVAVERAVGLERGGLDR